MLVVLESELADMREDLIGRVSRIDALSDLRYHALTFRERTGIEPTYEGLLEAATDEIARAELVALGRRITTAKENR